MSNWRELAACRGMGTEIFFPERGEDTDAAKAICDVCPVTEECLEEQMRLRVSGADFGVWGGTSARQRKALSIQRRKEREWLLQQATA